MTSRRGDIARASHCISMFDRHAVSEIDAQEDGVQQLDLNQLALKATYPVPDRTSTTCSTPSPDCDPGCRHLAGRYN